MRFTFHSTVAICTCIGWGARASALELFSVGFEVPQSISVAPADFGEHAGRLLIPDPGAPPIKPGNSRIMAVSPEDGTSEVFAKLTDLDDPGLAHGFRGGTFLPREFGRYGGNFVVTGAAGILAFDADARGSTFVEANDLANGSNAYFRLTTPVVAPLDFGDVGGQLLVTHQIAVKPDRTDPYGGVIAIDPDGLIQQFSIPSVAHESDPTFTDNIFEPFGAAFAPTEFGAFAERLLVSDAQSNRITAIDHLGNHQLFARVPLDIGQVGLRQIAISPSSFGDLGDMVFVSVAGSPQGGGGWGSVHVINQSGEVSATLKLDERFADFDPRGLFFNEQGSLLISDASNRILSAETGDFDINIALQPGDADRDLDFDQLDLIRVLSASKYATGQPATWGDGDWNGAPGGTPDSPPAGDGAFDQHDIIAALRGDAYLSGPYASLRTSLADASFVGAMPSGQEVDLVSVPEASPRALMVCGVLVVLAGCLCRERYTHAANSFRVRTSPSLGCWLAPKSVATAIAALLLLGVGTTVIADELGTHGYADSDGVKIHYVAAGQGPLLVMIHGFPDFWYTWRNHMPALARHYKVVAIDQRGYNKSDKPAGVENYAMSVLVGDVVAVIKHFGQEKAVIVGHDWGGAVAWFLAVTHPELVERLVILNTPHPHGLARELAENPRQQKNSAYARRFQQPQAAASLTAEGLAAWVEDKEARAKYVAAFNRSSIEAMLNYYKANYPREPYKMPDQLLPKVKSPVLMIHGLKDEALLATGLNNTWEWVEQDLTLITVPDSGHFVQHDASELVTKSIVQWLTSR